MFDKLKQLINAMNSKGIPLPMFRDPETGKSSISLTLLITSFIIIVVGLVGKFSKMLDINLGEALTLFGITSSLYFGHKTFSPGMKVDNINEK